MGQELEETAADMNMWVAGTQTGLVALRMTSAVPAIPLHMVEAAISRARHAQLASLASLQNDVTVVGVLLHCSPGFAISTHTPFQ